MADPARLDVDGRTATLTLNRPDARNALSIELLGSLADHLTTLEGMCAGPDGPTVVRLTGEGRAFCAGMDLAEVTISAPGDEARPAALLHALGATALRIRRLPAVVVAKVNGPAIGGGCGLACVADIAVTFADNKMGFPEVDLGICPAVVAPWVVRKIGAGRARLVLLSGGLMSGRRAHELGIVDHCVDQAADLDGATEQIVGRLASGGALALAATKRLCNDLDGSLDEDLSRRGAELSASVLLTEPAQAALRARKR